MSAVRDLERDAAAGVVIVDAPEGLSTIHRAGCAAAICRRQLPPSLLDWLDGLAPSQLPRMRQVLRSDVVRSAVEAACDANGTPDGPEHAALIDDVAGLASLFADVSGAPYLRVRLDVITTNACRRFHIDAVTARLICTYRGTGTQYGMSDDGGEPERVFTAPTGAPIVLRGTVWPEDPPAGLLHRSPPIAGTGETRLLLVLDPIHDPDDEME